MEELSFCSAPLVGGVVSVFIFLVAKLLLSALVLGWLAALDLVMPEKYPVEEVSTLVLLIIQAFHL